MHKITHLVIYAISVIGVAQNSCHRFYFAVILNFPCASVLVTSTLCVCDLAINAENAVHRSDKFLAMATRTRQEYLKDLAQNYVSPTLVDSGSRLGVFMTLMLSVLFAIFS